MKPRIALYRALSWGLRGCVVWRCAGNGFAGFGGTPEAAYWDWRARAEGRK